MNRAKLKQIVHLWAFRSFYEKGRTIRSLKQHHSSTSGARPIDYELAKKTLYDKKTDIQKTAAFLPHGTADTDYPPAGWKRSFLVNNLMEGLLTAMFVHFAVALTSGV